jgi:hypothetical protein
MNCNDFDEYEILLESERAVEMRAHAKRLNRLLRDSRLLSEVYREHLRDAPSIKDLDEYAMGLIDDPGRSRTIEGHLEQDGFARRYVESVKKMNMELDQIPQESDEPLPERIKNLVEDLGRRTIEERVAQTAEAIGIERKVIPIFINKSKSATPDAIAATPEDIQQKEEQKPQTITSTKDEDEKDR